MHTPEHTVADDLAFSELTNLVVTEAEGNPKGELYYLWESYSVSRERIDSWLFERSQKTGRNLDAQQTEVLYAALCGARRNVFYTGGGGVGKSFVTEAIIDFFQDCFDEELFRETVAVTASTGIAATHICGCTIHSAMGIGKPAFHSSFGRMFSDKKRLKDLRNKLKVVIIDEISMLSGEFLDCLDANLKEIMGQGCYNPLDAGTLVTATTNIESVLTAENPGAAVTTDNTVGSSSNWLPTSFMSSACSSSFGGKQLIICGDFFQLPPVETSLPASTIRDIDPASMAGPIYSPRLKNSRPDNLIFTNRGFAFQSAFFYAADFVYFVLTNVYRQRDEKVLVNHLNLIRLGHAGDATVRYFNQIGEQIKLNSGRYFPSPFSSHHFVIGHRACTLYTF
jgi:hypothetical protein